ncbi:MAG: hypothetical protein NWS46_09175 [Cyclobacteriaceae bacterium]|jgi:hypothetical protein|nr:hypothetical protein [Cyclobacteriaceae bacterium]
MANEGYNSELVEAEGYYTKMILSKKKEIAKYEIFNPELLVDINGLDSMYTDLENDLKVYQKDDRLINAMIRNLQQSVDILNKQLNILEQLKMIEEDEKISI